MRNGRGRHCRSGPDSAPRAARSGVIARIAEKKWSFSWSPPGAACRRRVRQGVVCEPPSWPSAWF